MDRLQRAVLCKRQAHRSTISYSQRFIHWNACLVLCQSQQLRKLRNSYISHTVLFTMANKKNKGKMKSGSDKRPRVD